jgi:hypothetical protein
MEMSSEAYASLDPTNLDNFKNPLHLPGDDGLMGVLDASNAPVRFTAHKASVEILPGKGADLLAYHAERDGKSYVNSTIRVQRGRGYPQSSPTTSTRRPPSTGTGCTSTGEWTATPSGR